MANGNPGVWDLPDGEAYYRWALKAATTTTRTPPEIHALGREQSRVILNRMDVILRKRGLASGTVGARYAALSKDPASSIPTPPLAASNCWHISTPRWPTSAPACRGLSRLWFRAS